MCVISNFQIKILPEYWNVFWYMLQSGSLACRLGWSLVLGCVSGVPLGSTLWNREGRNRVGQREGSSCITVRWPELTPCGSGVMMALQGFLTRPLARTLYLSLDGSLDIGCPQRGWWFNVAHWQHLQQLDKSLKGGQDSMSPCSPHSMYHSSRGRWRGCTVGETLDWCVSKNGDLVILLCWGPEWGTPPVAKVMRKEARHMQRRDRASGVPLEILEHLPP